MSQPGDPQYGQPPWAWQPAPTTWPHGPGRPGVATAAAVLGFVTAGHGRFVVLALPLPLLTAIFAGQRAVRDWVAAGPG